MQIGVDLMLNPFPFEWINCAGCAMEDADLWGMFHIDMVGGDKDLIDNCVNRNVVINQASANR